MRTRYPIITGVTETLLVLAGQRHSGAEPAEQVVIPALPGFCQAGHAVQQP